MDVLLVIGGDGFMLKTLRNFRNAKIPFYGLNGGRIGFLMNNFLEQDDLEAIIGDNSESIYLDTPRVELLDESGTNWETFFINELCLHRNVFKSCSLTVKLNSIERLKNYYGDGIIVATAIGSTAYNYSAGGPVLPLGAKYLSMSAICPSYGCLFRNAIIGDNSTVEFTVNDYNVRKVSASVDGIEHKNIKHVRLLPSSGEKIKLLSNRHRPLSEKILARQFLQNFYSSEE
jgi:NAD+ kinase